VRPVLVRGKRGVFLSCPEETYISDKEMKGIYLAQGKKGAATGNSFSEREAPTGRRIQKKEICAPVSWAVALASTRKEGQQKRKWAV